MARKSREKAQKNAGGDFRAWGGAFPERFFSWLFAIFRG
jgi:hypothetical protein